MIVFGAVIVVGQEILTSKTKVCYRYSTILYLLFPVARVSHFLVSVFFLWRDVAWRGMAFCCCCCLRCLLFVFCFLLLWFAIGMVYCLCCTVVCCLGYDLHLHITPRSCRPHHHPAYCNRTYMYFVVTPSHTHAHTITHAHAHAYIYTHAVSVLACPVWWFKFYCCTVDG